LKIGFNYIQYSFKDKTVLKIHFDMYYHLLYTIICLDCHPAISFELLTILLYHHLYQDA